MLSSQVVPTTSEGIKFSLTGESAAVITEDGPAAMTTALTLRLDGQRGPKLREGAYVLLPSGTPLAGLVLTPGEPNSPISYYDGTPVRFQCVLLDISRV